MVFGSESHIGKVHTYTSRVNPTFVKPEMVLKHKVTPELKPILTALARGYSPVRSKLFIYYFLVYIIDDFFVDDNHQVFVMKMIYGQSRDVMNMR